MGLQGGPRPLYGQQHHFPLSIKMLLAFSTVLILDHSAKIPHLSQNATMETSGSHHYAPPHSHGGRGKPGSLGCPQ